MEIPDTITNSLERDAYARGWNHGHGFACHNVPSIGDKIDRSIDYVGCGDTVDFENIREYHELICFAAESNSRDFSPFEFIAHEFNSCEDADTSPEALWEAFEEGTGDAIRADLATYDNDDYGIEFSELFVNLDELIRSEGFETFRESKLGNDLFISDPERAERIHDAAEDGCEGSTHLEIIEDWREYLATVEIYDPAESDPGIEGIRESTRDAISEAIDLCETWHEENGTLHQEVG